MFSLPTCLFAVILFKMVQNYEVRYVLTNDSPYIIMVGRWDFPFIWRQYVDVYFEEELLKPKYSYPQNNGSTDFMLILNLAMLYQCLRNLELSLAFPLTNHFCLLSMKTNKI